jgi:octaprenyl-diphosphate synthase
VAFSLKQNYIPQSITQTVLFFQNELDQLERLIEEQLRQATPMICDVGLHLVRSGGKRIRALLTLVCKKFLGPIGEQSIKAALAIELVHNATLLHDDVIDNSLLRRGQKTAHLVWGTNHSILTGDYLLSAALKIMTELESWPALKALQKASTKIVEGQALELSKTDDPFQEERYLTIVSWKTAALFQAATSMAAIVEDAPLEVVEHLEIFGYTLGVAFQIIDDILDYDAAEHIFGKRIGQDFEEGKVTLPIIKAYKCGNAEEQAFWFRIFIERQQTSEDFDHAKELLRKHRSLGHAFQTAQEYLAKTKTTLDMLSNDPLTRSLVNNIIESIITQLSQELRLQESLIP